MLLRILTSCTDAVNPFAAFCQRLLVRDEDQPMPKLKPAGNPRQRTANEAKVRLNPEDVRSVSRQ